MSLFLHDINTIISYISSHWMESWIFCIKVINMHVFVYFVGILSNVLCCYLIIPVEWLHHFKSMFLSKVDFSSFTCSEKRNSPSLISYWKGKKKDLQLINNENNYLKPHYSHFCLFRWNAFVPFILHIMFSNWFKRTITKQWCPPKKTKKSRLLGASICRVIRLFFFLTTGSSSSTPFSTPRQPLPPPLSLPPLSGTQSSYRSPQTSRRQVRSSITWSKAVRSLALGDSIGQ